MCAPPGKGGGVGRVRGPAALCAGPAPVRPQPWYACLFHCGWVQPPGAGRVLLDRGRPRQRAPRPRDPRCGGVQLPGASPASSGPRSAPAARHGRATPGTRGTEGKDAYSLCSRVKLFSACTYPLRLRHLSSSYSGCPWETKGSIWPSATGVRAHHKQPAMYAAHFLSLAECLSLCTGDGTKSVIE
jgi:hypothetical protein